MFNLNTNYLLTVNTLYVFNFFVFLLYNLNVLNNNKTQALIFNNKILNIFNNMLILNFAGLPPFFFFFFKMLIILNTKHTVFVLCMFALTNTAIVYYYITFIYINKKQKSLTIVKNNLINHNLALYMVVFNIYCFICVDYLLYFLLYV